MAKSTVEPSTETVVGLTEKAPIHVLHMDDDAGFLKVAKQLLEMQGSFKVDTASSVEEAQEKMKKKRYDAVVSDYQMPEKDGLEFLKELRREGNTVSFIMFTGKGREDVAMAALNLGADQYLNKLGDPETVYGELAHSIGKSVKAKQAEERVRESEEKYRSLFENAKDVIVLMDLKGNLTAINKVAVEYGFKKDKVIGRNMRKFVPKRYWPKLLKELVQLARGKIVEGKIEITTPKGKKNAEYWSNPIIIDNKVVGVQTVLRDVTERKQVEDDRNKLLHNHGERVKELDCLYGISELVEKPHISLEEIFQGTANLLPPAWQYPDVACARIIFEGREFKTKNFKKTRWKQHADIRVHGKKAGTVEVYYLEEKLKSAGGPFLKEEITLIGVVAERLGRISERKQTEQRYRDLVEKARDSIYTLDDKGNITFANPASILGYQPEEVIGKNFMELVPKEWQEKTAADFNKLLKTGEITAETVLLDKKGQPHFVEYNSTVIKEGDKVVGTRGIVRDISERKKAEEELIRLSNAVKMSTDSTVISDLDARIIDVNEATLKMYGTDDKRDLIGQNSFTLIAPEDREKALAGTKETLEKGYVKNREYNIVTKDGGRVPVEMSVAIMKDVSGKPIGFVGISRDITERKKAEDELRNSEERLKILFDFAPDAHYLNDLKGNFVDGNKAAEELTGYKRSELIGKSFLKLRVLSRRQILKATKLLAKNALGKPTGPDEFVLNRKDGAQVPVEIRTYPVKIKDQTLVLGIARDISERKRAETTLKMMNEKLRVVGGLTRHDIRNKLSAVTGNVFLTKQKLPAEHEALGYLEDTESAVRQMQEIFDFARTYEMLGAEELAYMDVEKTVEEAVSLFSDLHGAKVVNDCRGLTVLADSLLRQFFYNLIHNSLKHGEKVGQIRVYYEEAGKDQLRLVYEDDGVGIRKAEKEKIFNEGYGKGTGYGLYLIRRMCEVYGWTIHETGKQGKGAEFTITMPQMNENGKENYRLL